MFCLPLACSGGGDKARQRPAPLVAAQKVVVTDVDVEVRAPVDLRPLVLADVGSKTLGYLDAVLVDRGDAVKKGQLLALVRPSDLPDQLAAARGSHAQAQASLQLARTNAERAKALAPTGVVSQQETQQANAALAAAEAAEASAAAQMSALATRLGETHIVSPLDGVVTQRRLDPGALVGLQAGATILSVARVDVLRVFIAVNEREASGVRVGQSAYVEVDAMAHRRFTGKVVRLSPGFDLTTRTLEAEVQLDNKSGELRPGMYGRGAIILETHPQAVTVAVGAVQISDKAKYVFVVQGDKVSRREVEIGVDHGEWLEIKRGLRPGEEVVVAGADGLSDQATVRVSRDVDPYTGEKMAHGSQATSQPKTD